MEWSNKTSIPYCKDRLGKLIRDLAFTRGAVTLSSGIKSDYYFDIKRVTLNQTGAYNTGHAVYDLITNHLPFKVDAIGGMAIGACPIVDSVLSTNCRNGDITSFEGFYVRQEKKSYGMLHKIDNQPKKGSKVVIVDDVVTTGQSMLDAIGASREAGLDIVAAIALIDREEYRYHAGALIADAVDTHAYQSLFTAKDFL